MTIISHFLSKLEQVVNIRASWPVSKAPPFEHILLDITANRQYNQLYAACCVVLQVGDNMSEEDAAAAARLIALNMLATLKCKSGRLTMQQLPNVCVFPGMVAW